MRTEGYDPSYHMLNLHLSRLYQYLLTLQFVTFCRYLLTSD
jgi:hypothetical protein